MRRILITFWILTTIAFTSCKSKEQVYSNNYEIAIIETTGNDNKSSIYYYNDELELLNEYSLPYGTMGNIFYNPVIFNNNLYSIPQGLANEKDLKRVIEFNLEDGKVTEYKIDQLAMNSLAVNNEYIYTCNTVNGISYINQYTLEDDIVNIVEIAEVYISKLMVAEEEIYAFGSIKGENGIEAYIYVFDSMLNSKEKINITSSGSSQYKAIFIDGYLYFSNLMDKNDQPGKTVSRMSINNHEVENIKLNSPYPSDLLQYNDYLVIAHCNLVTNEGNSITFYNMKEETIEEVTLNHPVTQINTKENYLYIFDGNNLFKYEINQDKISELELIKEIELKKVETSDNYNYISGFYVK